MLLLFLTTFSLLIWLYLALFHGGWPQPFWRADQRLEALSQLHLATRNWPKVVAVIPARDEVASIWPVIASHMATDYPGPFEVILVDDHSNDGTAELARAGANHDPRLTILSPPPLPDGWTGKLWALHHGIAHAEAMTQQPEYLLLTDADITHAPDTLRKLVAKAQTQNLVLVSLMARLDARGFWGMILIPAFIYFFMKLYPFAKANDPHAKLAAAAGGCMLINTERLCQTGSIKTIKNALIDDCALAHQLKNTAPRAAIFLGLANKEVVSLRDNQSLASVWHMVSRTAYTQLDYSVLKLTGTLIAMILVYLMAPLTLLLMPLHGNTPAFWIAMTTIITMALTYAPIVRLYKGSVLTILSLPIAALLYCAMTASSAHNHWRGKGGQWKGRNYTLSKNRFTIP